MTSQDIHRNATKKLPFLLAALIMSPLTHAQVRIEITTVPAIPEQGEAGRIVTSIRAQAMRQPQDDWEKSLLAAGERSFPRVLATKIGPVLGMSTVKVDGN